jgi:hypothetical protein
MPELDDLIKQAVSEIDTDGQVHVDTYFAIVNLGLDPTMIEEINQ